MRFCLEDLDPQIGYKLLAATVTPRPIAWVTTLSTDGIVNAAPYSFFNVVGKEPPVVVLGLMRPDDRTLKDTARNILETNEFVINLVNEKQANIMNLSSMNAPMDVSEAQALDLDLVPSNRVKPPQIKSSPVSFECVNMTTLTTGPRQILVVGRVVEVRIDREYVIDAERGYVDTPKMGLIARMHGSGWYARSDNLFEIERLTYDEWLKTSSNQKTSD